MPRGKGESSMDTDQMDKHLLAREHAFSDHLQRAHSFTKIKIFVRYSDRSHSLGSTLRERGAGMLLLEFLCDMLISPVHRRHVAGRPK